MRKTLSVLFSAALALAMLPASAFAAPVAQATLYDVVQLGTSFRQDKIDAVYEFLLPQVMNPTGSYDTKLGRNSIDFTVPDSIGATGSEIAKAALRIYASPETFDLTESYRDVFFSYDADEVKRVANSISSGCVGFGYNQKLSEKPLAALNARQQAVDAKAAEAMTWIDDSMTDAQKAKALYDFVTTTIRYGGGKTSSTTSAYDGLVDGLTTCAGFAKSYSYLLYKAGIESRLVSGSRYDGHAWNMVKIGGSWYHCDPTNDRGGSGTCFLLSDESVKRMGYRWHTDRFIGGTYDTPATPAQDYADDALRNHTYTGPSKEFAQSASCSPILALTVPGTISVMWGKSQGATGYELWRSTSQSGPFAKVADVTDASYTDGNLDAAMTYFYKVRAYKGDGSSRTYAPESQAASLKANYDLGKTIAQIDGIGQANYEYERSPQTPEPVVTYGANALVKDRDYRLSYRDNVDVGAGVVVITGINGCTGSRELGFRITPCDIQHFDHSYPRDQVYTGKPIEPDIDLGVPGGWWPAGTDDTLVEGRDYTVRYSDNVNVGRATVTFTGIGNFSGECTAGFNIVEAQAADDLDTTDPGTTDPGTTDPEPVGTQAMYRLYNPNSGEHFYTASAVERNAVIDAGWNDEGIGWTAPTEGVKVYRLYNSIAGEHHYTTSAEERDMLVGVGWTWEEGGWYSDPNESVPLYRAYNPNAYANNHHYTTDWGEFQTLLSLGWQDEGVGWHGVVA